MNSRLDQRIAEREHVLWEVVVIVDLHLDSV
jgi:hypothetical protein